MLAQLLEAALRSLALGSVVWLSLRFLLVRDPQVRMTAWTAVLAASVLMPLLLHAFTVTIPAHAPPPDTAVPAASSASVRGAPAGPIVFEPEKPRLPSSGDDPDPAWHSQSSSGGPAHATAGWHAFAAGLYLAIAGGLLLRLLLGLALTWRILRRGRPAAEEWAQGLDVRLSAAISAPVTFGTAILLPAGCLDWSPVKRQAVLAHEQSHAARGDFYVLLLATLYRAVFWFSPFSWWLLNELAETAEQVSDDAAIEAVGDRPSYAEILLDIARQAHRLPSGIAMARTRNALNRVNQILSVTSPPPRRLGWGKLALVAISVAPLAAIAAVSLARETNLARAASEAGLPIDRYPASLLETASRAGAPKLWILARLRPGPNRPVLTESYDMFSLDAAWKTVAAHTAVVKLAPGAILNGKDEELKRAFQNIAARHIALAVEIRALVRTGQCTQKTKAHSNPGDIERMLERMRGLGADPKYVIMIDPFFYGHRFDGPGSCREPPEELARHIAQKLQLIHTYFPSAEVGTSDVVDESRPWIDELVNWADVYQRVAGEPLAFFHAGVAWSPPAMENLAILAAAMKARRIPFGVTYDSSDESSSNEAWVDSALQHIAQVESVIGIRPDTAVFKGGFYHPNHLLPETEPGTLTNLAFQYLLAPPSITLTRQANIVTGEMADAQGHPVASANLTVEALDVAGRMDLLEHRLTGKVPAEAVAVLLGIRVNAGGSCVCAGTASASVGTIRYHEPVTGRNEEIPPFLSAAGHAHPSVRVMQLTPGEPQILNFKLFPVTPNADYNLDAPLSVTANGERAGHIALMFLDGSGQEIWRDQLWFRPSAIRLGSAVTNAEGRFQLDIPSRVAEAGAAIRAYFPGNASIGSQTVTISQ